MKMLDHPSGKSTTWRRRPRSYSHLISKVTRCLRNCIFLYFSEENNHTYNVPPGLNYYVIPRSDFVIFSKMKIDVKAANQLGEASSLPITLEPVGAGRTEGGHRPE